MGATISSRAKSIEPLVPGTELERGPCDNFVNCFGIQYFVVAQENLSFNKKLMKKFCTFFIFKRENKPLKSTLYIILTNVIVNQDCKSYSKIKLPIYQIWTNKSKLQHL